MKNSFSIIIPVYNVYKFLDKCLSSVINQNYDNYEVIIIDDGSTDDSYKIINKYKEKYPYLIRNFYKENGGLSSARNYGITKAKNDYLLFVDSDDYISNNTLEILNKKINETKSDIIIFNYVAIYKNKQEKIITFNKKINEIDKRYLLSFPSACNKVFNRNLFKNAKFIEGIYYEDLATIPRLIKQTKNISFIDDYLYYYLVRDDSITNKTNYNKKMDDIFYVTNLLKKELIKEYKEEIEFIFIEHLLRNAGIRFINYSKYDKIKEITNIMKKDFPNWRKNTYYKKYYTTKQKVLSYLIYKRIFFIISLLRYKVGKK